MYDYTKCPDECPKLAMYADMFSTDFDCDEGKNPNTCDMPKWLIDFKPSEKVLLPRRVGRSLREQ